MEPRVRPTYYKIHDLPEGTRPRERLARWAPVV